MIRSKPLFENISLCCCRKLFCLLFSILKGNKIIIHNYKFMPFSKLRIRKRKKWKNDSKHFDFFFFFFFFFFFLIYQRITKKKVSIPSLSFCICFYLFMQNCWNIIFIILNEQEVTLLRWLHFLFVHKYYLWFF